MDASFTFPRPQAPVPRPAPASKAGGPQVSRESNALRASVLDAALELGLVSNPLVANWMFENSLPEENEEVSFLFGSQHLQLFFWRLHPTTPSPFKTFSHPFPFCRGVWGIRGCLAVITVLDAKLSQYGIIAFNSIVSCSAYFHFIN